MDAMSNKNAVAQYTGKNAVAQYTGKNVVAQYTEKAVAQYVKHWEELGVKKLPLGNIIRIKFKILEAQLLCGNINAANDTIRSVESLKSSRFNFKHRLL